MEREHIEGVHTLSEDEGRALFERHAREQLNMSGEEFIAAWNHGQFKDNIDTPEVMSVAMLMPLAL